MHNLCKLCEGPTDIHHHEVVLLFHVAIMNATFVYVNIAVLFSNLSMDFFTKYGGGGGGGQTHSFLAIVTISPSFDSSFL